MDRRERSGSWESAFTAFGDGLQAGIWTALPGIIQSFNAAEKTCSVQPAIKAQRMLPDHSTEWVTLPILTDCPVQFPGGGGGTLTFPLKLGDECLVVFASRCIDAWWQSGGIQVQAELRMHDLSDGFCIPGISSVPRVQPAISTTHLELRTDDGTAEVRINVETKAVDVQTTADITLTGANVRVVGNLVVNGENYTAHRHSGVSTGTGNTGGKVP